MKADKKRGIVIRYLKAYVSVIAVVASVVAISEAKGAGWRPALAGMPMYVTLLLLVTYQLIKELRALKRDEQEEGSTNNEGQ
jgi:hypothetical protein